MFSYLKNAVNLGPKFREGSTKKYFVELQDAVYKVGVAGMKSQHLPDLQVVQNMAVEASLLFPFDEKNHKIIDDCARQIRKLKELPSVCSRE